MGGQEECFQVISSLHVHGRPLVHLLGKDLQQAHRDVSIQEGKPLEQEAPRVVDSLLITPPVLQTVFYKVLENVQTFRGGYVPVAFLLDFGRQPWLDKGSPTEHCCLR